jgi:hypothetical protein
MLSGGKVTSANFEMALLEAKEKRSEPPKRMFA